jgi:hypothetical protein
MEEPTTAVTEIWKDVPFENLGHYEISNLGRVKVKATQKIMKLNTTNIYLSITLSSMGKKINKCINIHRLVSLAFIPNPNNYKVVNHIDGNKLNNYHTNLEWMTQSQNVKHSRGDNYISPSNISIYRITINGKNKVKYESTLLAAAANNASFKNINDCLRGRTHTSSGYKWKYCDDKHKSVETDLTQMTKIPKYNHYYINREGKIYSNRSKRFLKTTVNNYPIVGLKNKGSEKKHAVHRLVAQIFIPNPNNCKVVNHKDGNKLNHRVDNLEWTTHSENTLHAHRTGLIKLVTKKVISIDSNEVKKEYDSIRIAASHHNVGKSHINNAIIRKGSSCGVKWIYKEEEKEEDDED